MARRVTWFLRWVWGAEDDVGVAALVRSTPAAWAVLAITVVVSVADFALPAVMGVDLVTHHLGDATARIAKGEVWRLITPELVNPPSYGMRFMSGAEHLAWNIVGLVLAGVRVERTLGTRRFVVLYVIAGLASQVALFAALPLRWSSGGGSSGSVHGLFGAVLVIAFLQRGEDRRKFWYFVVSWALLALNTAGAFMNSATTNIIHLGGALAGIALTVAWIVRRIPWPRAGTAVALAIVLVSASIVIPRSALAHRVDPAVVAEIPMGRVPELLTLAFGSVWVNGEGSGSLTRIDPYTERVVTIRGGFAGGMVQGGDSLWVGARSAVAEIDPRTNRVRSRVRVPGEGPWGVAASSGVIWAALPDKGQVARIQVRTHEVTLTRVGRRPFAVASNGRAVWASAFDSRTVSRLDLRTGRVARRVRLDRRAYWLQPVRGSLWVGAEDHVYRLDPSTLKVQARVPIGQIVWSMSVDADGQLWVAERWGLEVSQIDTRTNRVVRRLRVGLRQPIGVGAGEDVWIADTVGRSVLRAELSKGG
jgi:membrane associated rhomboid family serine protease